MSIQLEWDNTEKTVLRWIFTGCWSWGDMSAHFDDLEQALDSVNHSVDYIIDFTSAASVPTFTPMRLYKSETPDSASGLMIAVGDAAYAPTILMMARHLYISNLKEPQVHFMPSLEIARDFLQGMRIAQNS